MWYCVHAFLYFAYKDGDQCDYPGWENMYLIEADSVDQARQKGRDRARADEGDSEGTLTYDGRPAKVTLAGLIKIIACEDLDLDTGKPSDGTEVSYTDLLIADKTQLQNLLAGEPAVVTYQ